MKLGGMGGGENEGLEGNVMMREKEVGEVSLGMGMLEEEVEMW